MTNEQLKKKICDIIAPYVSAYGDDERIADALIAAGIGFKDKHRVFVENVTLPKNGDCDAFFVPNTQLKITQLYGDEEVEQIVKERDEYKHRAEVAEQKYKLLFQKYDSFFNDVTYCHKNFSDVDSEITKQAEKELAEEGKDE